MRLKRTIILLYVVAALFICSNSASAFGVKYKTSGTFADSGGGQHPWSVNDGHTLIWDSKPYIPVGTVFVSQYLDSDSSQDAYDADIKNLDALKGKGITDIILKSSGPISSSKPASLQKMISYLDENGFSYGLELGDGPRQALRGYIIAPGCYRQEGPSDQTTIKCDWPDVDSAIYIIVSKFDNSIKANGGAIVRDGKVTIYLSSPLKSGELLIVYPHKTLDDVGDLWAGFDEYRDRVLAFFKGIKFGAGMRFFIEPFTSKMDFTENMNSFLPTSGGFRLGLEAYLTRKYRFEGGLNGAWGRNENLDSIERATRLIPLWSQTRGVPYAYDMASARLYSANPSVAVQMWQDILDYRDTSAQEYMNTIADTLRKQVANVPVIFKSDTYHRIYANPYGLGGMDGLAAQTYGTGEAPVDRVAGPLYSLAEESSKSTWFIVAGTQASSDGSTPYLGESAMMGTLDSFREVGCKGFFVDKVNGDSQQAEWLAAFKGKIGKEWTDFKPTVINYPVNPMTGAYVKRLARDTWWLPSLRNGETTFIGDTLLAYSIFGEGKSYLWSNTGKRTVTMNARAGGTPAVDYPPGVSISAKKKVYTLDLTDTPTVIRGISFTEVFPQDTAQEQIDMLVELIALADKREVDVKKARGGLESAKRVVANGQAYIAYGIAKEAADELRSILGSDLWIEGEQSPAANFGKVLAAPDASAGLALVLDTAEDAPLDAYSTQYGFSTSASSSYEIWLAATSPRDSSPISYSVDGSGWTKISADEQKTVDYAPGLCWYKIGTSNMAPGNHSISFKIDGKRSQDNRYYFAIDAIVLSPRGFIPDGINKPF
ncbi:MAG: hypothetical protein GX139_12780 [Armatimonadetes bacterium]|nr:hypothetical protein [Armatimonadota bacterium]